MKTPVWGCVLIGGKSRRMKTAKHLIEDDGITWLEKTIRCLEKVVENVVIVGAGEIPEHLNQYDRLPDVSEAEGPMSGLLSVMRWKPHVSWLAAACDMPCMSSEALEWLLSKRRPGVWGILPKRENQSKAEPFLAYYDLRARFLLENLAAMGQYSLMECLDHPKIVSPCIPVELSNAWQNVNTVDEFCGG